MPDKRKHVVGFLEAFLKYGKNHSVMIILAGAVVLLQCLIVIFYEDTTVDAAYYVGTVSTSVYTDTLGRYNPFNGAIQKAFQARYVFSAYPMHNAVWCRLLGIHPIVQAKQVMSCMNVVTANLIIYQIGKRLFDGNRKKADLMLVFVCVLQLFCGTIYSSGTFFFTRSYEGKAILANIAIPAVLMCAVWYLQEKNSRNVWIILFVTAVSALTFSGSAIIFPIVIAAGMAPAAVMNKRFSGLVYCAVCMLPSALYAAVFFSMQNRSADAGCIIIQKGEKKLAGVTIQELGLRFVDACMRLYWGFLLVSSSVCCRTDLHTGPGAEKESPGYLSAIQYFCC